MNYANIIIETQPLIIYATINDIPSSFMLLDNNSTSIHNNK